MFPHTITIFHHEIQNGSDVYTRYVVPGVYWYGSTGISESGKGAEAVKDITIVTSPETARTYNKKWRAQAKDRIVKGEHPAISAFKELEGKEVMTVISVTDDVIGSNVDNVTIKGK